jgi:hypothetical protein
VTPTDDLETIAARLLRPLDLLLGFLTEAIKKEHDDCEAEGIDPLADVTTFDANVRRWVYGCMRPYLPLPSRAPMSPLYIDLGPYKLRVLHASQGGVPRPKTKARREYYRCNELGIMSMNVLPPGHLVEIDAEITEIEEGFLILIWSSDGPDLVQADLYRPPLHGFPGKALDLLAATVVVTEEDFPDVRRDDTGGESSAATGTDGVGALGATEEDSDPDDDDHEGGAGEPGDRGGLL